ncbi:DNA polymerase III subunit [Siphonobacter aquaeclarae]|uniref:DNA polymerase-3 subunit delta n=1 Tax=Siphonobacter aquaeclarae TaxID=563176 RepID=A0A1G9ULF9_9BACT|nr:DNA polymerase III subunit delta' [Siphonobacter aquaeclarae]SDM60375.1 DNA polymerase-3 subunit delta' [Siphonobacter aquaeclarae]
MLFRDVPGLPELKETLIQSVRNDHVAHAQLFHGPVGGAGLPLAIAFATYLNCENRGENDACGSCASCVKMRKLAHPDVHYIFPVAITKKVKDNESDAYMPLWREFMAAQPYGSLSDWLTFIGVEGNRQGNISAEEARNVIRKISLKAYEGEYKILILWQPELLNVYSANALLKILEEPPAKTVFLLVTTDANRLLTTIISRTQRIGVRAFTEEEVANYLSATTDAKQAKHLAYLSEGNLAKALELATGEGAEEHTWFATWMRHCYRGLPSFPDVVKLADEFDSKSKEAQKNLMAYGLNVFRDLLLWQGGTPELVRLEGDELTFVQNFSKVIVPERIAFIVEELTTAYYHLERNVRAKMIFLDLSLSLARLMRK